LDELEALELIVVSSYSPDTAVDGTGWETVNMASLSSRSWTNGGDAVGLPRASASVDARRVLERMC
jgi:hypothetical protein